MRQHTTLVESLHADPAVRPALLAVSIRMEAMGYSQHAREMLVEYVETTGTVTGCLDLDVIDEQIIEDTYVSALEPVPFDDPAWGPASLPSQAIPSRTEDIPAGLPPVCGGGFEPGEDDWRDYAAWSDALERERDREETMDALRTMDAMAAIRRAEERAPLWGYE